MRIPYAYIAARDQRPDRQSRHREVVSESPARPKKGRALGPANRSAHCYGAGPRGTNDCNARAGERKKGCETNPQLPSQEACNLFGVRSHTAPKRISAHSSIQNNICHSWARPGSRHAQPSLRRWRFARVCFCFNRRLKPSFSSTDPIRQPSPGLVTSGD